MLTLVPVSSTTRTRRPATVAFVTTNWPNRLLARTTISPGSARGGFCPTAGVTAIRRWSKSIVSA